MLEQIKEGQLPPTLPTLDDYRYDGGPEPNNRFFWNLDTHMYDGHSWDFALGSLQGKVGMIEPNTDYSYEITEPELIVLTIGEISITETKKMSHSPTSEPKSRFGLDDINQEVITGVLASRGTFVLPASKEKIRLETGENHAEYTCFYPKNEEDWLQIAAILENRVGVN